MRLSSICLFAVLALCACSTLADAQETTTCTPLPHDLSLSEEQQGARDVGERAACLAAKATDAHPLREAPKKSEGDIGLDDAINGDVLADHQPDVFDLYDAIGHKGCLNLLAAARRGVRRFSSNEGKIAYLNGIIAGIQKMGKCN